MGTGNRIGIVRAVLLLAAGAAGGGAALAVASVPDSDGTYHACVQMAVSGSATVPSTNGANLTMIDPSAGQHCIAPDGPSSPGQTEVSWNATGPQGPAGANGADGSPGAPGHSVTIASGQTLTLGGGQVVTVGGDRGGTTIASPTIDPRGRGLGQATLAGSGIPDFTVLGISSGPKTGTGKVSIHELTITKRVDAASPKLFQACATGKHIPSVTITVRRASGQAYLVYTLTNVLVSSYQDVAAGKSSQSAGSDRPVEQLSLNFTKVEIKS